MLDSRKREHQQLNAKNIYNRSRYAGMNTAEDWTLLLQVFFEKYS